MLRQTSQGIRKRAVWLRTIYRLTKKGARGPLLEKFHWLLLPIWKTGRKDGAKLVKKLSRAVDDINNDAPDLNKSTPLTKIKNELDIEGMKLLTYVSINSIRNHFLKKMFYLTPMSSLGEDLWDDKARRILTGDSSKIENLPLHS